ncbi:inositol hexakisphosphate kinase 1-like isoform X2 [Ischnura elegans]|uniref:inositol hexakisphosphate kinase 1-like isoform X2 n=1 Tax=Ischnura elegans TaxID=197161 RepID=UPI001ED8B076|nr:inositol hexakisphosphate kinase 1-like isoform X2 [Ischnura elegans]
MEDASEQKLIQLEPFAHQVGGHSSMLCLDGATVAKPLVVREQRFYETLPASLRPFVPSFLGALEVHVLQGEGGYVTHAAAPPPLYKPHLGIRTRRRIRLHDSGDIEIEGENEGMVFEDDDDEDRENIAAKLKEEDLTQLEDEELQKVDRVPRPSVGHALNPWVLRCHRESLSGLTPGMSQNFILLENLTARFKQPCVLDLKIGTRQYGDSASPAKVRSKMMKVVTTTSGKLGLRLGGMQVYQVTTRRFLCRNKLFGRTLTVDGFRMALVQFLHNGWCIRLDIVRPLLERLEALEAILSRLGAARFYTCSLLCLYEGELRTPSTTPLSPSTPAPPMTPGPFSAMPPGFFTSSSNRFNFPINNQSSMELSHSPSSLNGKLANVLANGKENAGVWGDVARSSPFAHAEQRNHTFPNSSSDGMSPAVETSTPHNSEVHGVSACISSSSSNSRRMAAVEEATSHSSNEPASPGIRESSGSISKITPQATVLPSRSGSASQWSHLTDVGTCPSDVKPHGSPIRGSRSSSPFTPCPHLLPSEGTPPVKSSTSCDSLNSHKGIVPHNLAAAISPKLENLEDEAVKGQLRKSRQRRETLGRSVSADSVSFSRVRYNALNKNEWKGGDAWLAKNDSYSDTKVNGYVTRDKEDWTSRLKDVRKRSRSLEPQMSLYPSSINQSPYFDDGAVSHYTSISANPLVDVRLIDFAHSTHKGLSDPVTYAGPDQGFLFGLHNLINLLRDIAHEAMTATERF